MILCEGCTKPITEKVCDFSQRNFGKNLCMECQIIAKSMPASPIQEEVVNVHQEEFDGDFIFLNGKKYVTHNGLLRRAHSLGLQGIVTEMISAPTADTVIFRATVRMKDDKVFSAFGDANNENVNRMIAPHKIRMCETRAINRALRLAIGLGVTSIEELGGQE